MNFVKSDWAKMALAFLVISASAFLMILAAVPSKGATHAQPAPPPHLEAVYTCNTDRLGCAENEVSHCDCGAAGAICTWKCFAP